MTVNEAEKLASKVPVIRNFSFSENTSFKCGGTAEKAYFPQTEREAQAVFFLLENSGGKYFILGAGSNVLAPDGVYEGDVICLKNLSHIERTGENSIFCLAGTKVAHLLSYCIKNGLTGLEYLAGIPATVGGVAYMNGGAGGRFIGSDVLNISFFDGKIHRFSNEFCNFGYKYSIMRDINGLITGVELKISPDSSVNVKKRISDFMFARSSQPKGASCGCVFKNPEGMYAGELIDRAGLKGLKIGSAHISKEHANFIINEGAVSSDVKKLIDLIKSEVFKKFSIKLEEEVVYI